MMRILFTQDFPKASQTNWVIVIQFKIMLRNFVEYSQEIIDCDSV